MTSCAGDPRPRCGRRCLASEPGPGLLLEGDAIDDALGAMGDFADLVSPFLLGHSAGVAELAVTAGALCGLDADELRALAQGSACPRPGSRRGTGACLAGGRTAVAR